MKERVGNIRKIDKLAHALSVMHSRATFLSEKGVCENPFTGGK